MELADKILVSLFLCSLFFSRCDPKMRKRRQKASSAGEGINQNRLPSAEDPVDGIPVREMAVPTRSKVTFECLSDIPAVWIRQRDMKVLSIGGMIVDVAIKSSKYGFGRRNKFYLLHIYDVQLADAGRYKCSNAVMLSLVVMEPPSCHPNPDLTIAWKLQSQKKPEVDAEFFRLKEGHPASFSCRAKYAGDSSPWLQWYLGHNRTLLTGSYYNTSSSVENELTLQPQMQHHLSSLSCHLQHPAWNEEYSKLSCEYPSLNVRFEPRFRCPRLLVLDDSSPKFAVECRIFSNPRIFESSLQIHVETADGFEIHRAVDDVAVRTHRFGVVHSLTLNRSLFLSKPYEYYVRYTLLPRLQPTLGSFPPSVSNDAFPPGDVFSASVDAGLKYPAFPSSSRSLSSSSGSHAYSSRHFGPIPQHPMTHSTHVVFHYGPKLVCPTENRIIVPERFWINISCTIDSNPVVPSENISWTITSAKKGNPYESPRRAFVPLQIAPIVSPIDANLQRVVLSFNRSLLHILPPQPVLTLSVRGLRQEATNNFSIRVTPSHFPPLSHNPFPLAPPPSSSSTSSSSDRHPLHSSKYSNHPRRIHGKMSVVVVVAGVIVLLLVVVLVVLVVCRKTGGMGGGGGPPVGVAVGGGGGGGEILLTDDFGGFGVAFPASVQAPPSALPPGAVPSSPFPGAAFACLEERRIFYHDAALTLDGAKDAAAFLAAAAATSNSAAARQQMQPSIQTLPRQHMPQQQLPSPLVAQRRQILYANADVGGGAKLIPMSTLARRKGAAACATFPATINDVIIGCNRMTADSLALSSSLANEADLLAKSADDDDSRGHRSNQSEAEKSQTIVDDPLVFGDDDDDVEKTTTTGTVSVWPTATTTITASITTTTSAATTSWPATMVNVFTKEEEKNNIIDLTQSEENKKVDDFDFCPKRITFSQQKSEIIGDAANRDGLDVASDANIGAHEENGAESFDTIGGSFTGNSSASGVLSPSPAPQTDLKRFLSHQM